MKHEIKGAIIWLLNISLGFVINELFTEELFTTSQKKQSLGVVPMYLAIVIIWLMTSFLVISALVERSERKSRDKLIQKTALSYSFINTSILLSTETIQKNGFREVWRQENEENSMQILCFNDETKQFQAFDRFHWMNEPHDVENLFSSYVSDGKGNVIVEPWIEPEGIRRGKDLWTPIDLHFTLDWLTKHLV